jgi:hypothetical protein
MQDTEPGPLHFSRLVPASAKHLAHNRVSAAIESGELAPRPCEVCGHERAIAHHDDYAQPLEVRWLCHHHHAERHRAFGHSSTIPRQPKREGEAPAADTMPRSKRGGKRQGAGRPKTGARGTVLGLRVTAEDFQRARQVLRGSETLSDLLRESFMAEVERRVAAARRVLKQEKEG